MREWYLLLLGLGLAATGAAAAVEPSPYHCSPSDVLEVTVAPQHTFDRAITIQPDGTITYPVIGRFQAAGLTVTQLEAKLREGLNNELVDPQVSVVLKEFKQAARRVSL